MHIKKKDTVKVVAGNHRGKTGIVLKVFPDTNRVIVEKINMVKRHTKQSQQAPQGGIVEREGTVEASNVMLVCPKCSKATRTGTVVLKDGSRVRTCKSCNEMLAN